MPKENGNPDDELKCGDCPHTVKVSDIVPEWVYGVDWYGECDLYYDGRHADQRDNPICKVRRMELALIARAEAAEADNERLNRTLKRCGVMLVTGESWDKIIDLVENPPEPTEAMKKLFGVQSDNHQVEKKED